MNPLLIFKAIRDLNALIQQANDLAGPDKRWTLAFTNRSFILAAVALLAQIALAVGVPLPVPADMAAETVWAVVSLISLGWAGVERMTGKTRAVWNTKQAVDALDEALTKAGVK